MFYKIDKTSLKKSMDKISNIESEYLYIKTENGKLMICDYDENATFILNIKVLESDNENIVLKFNKNDFLNMFNSISIIKNGIKDRAYCFKTTSEEDFELIVTIKGELKKDDIKKHLSIPDDEIWDRKTLVEKAIELLPSRTLKLKEKLCETLKKDINENPFNVDSVVIEDYNTRSAKVQIEHHISLKCKYEEDKTFDKFEYKKNFEFYFISEILQFKEMLRTINLVTINENYLDAMTNICVTANGEYCHFISSDMFRILKSSIYLNKNCNDYLKLIIPKKFLQTFVNFNKEDLSVAVKGYISNDGLALQTESGVCIFNKDCSLKDINIDVVSTALRMQNIKLSELQCDKFKHQCLDLKKYIKSLQEISSTEFNELSEENSNIKRISKPKGLESYKIAFEIVDNDVKNFKIERTYEKLAVNENMYVYNLNYFYSIINALSSINYKQNNFDIYFDKLTKIAFLKTYGFNSATYTTIAIFPINEK